MKISVVTISFNQAQYLEACLDSVAQQEGPWEHIIVDPGSTDGSRDVIERRKHQFSNIIFEPDRGPSDGLNKGFAKATGDVLFYLNSDDTSLPCAFEEARRAFEADRSVDVLSGHGVIIDENSQIMRTIYSDPISRHRLAHGGGIRIQPATFIRREAFEKTNGFNVENRSNWDGELIVDLFLAGAHFSIINQVWAGYRLHETSITATGKLDERIKQWAERRYKILKGRSPSRSSAVYNRFYAFERALRHPDTILARLLGGSIYGARRNG